MKPMSVQGSVRALRSVQPTPGRQRDRRIEELLTEEGDDTILDPRLGGGNDPQKEEEQEELSLPPPMEKKREPEPWFEDETYRPDAAQLLTQVKEVLARPPARQRPAKERAATPATPVYISAARPRTAFVTPNSQERAAAHPAPPPTPESLLKSLPRSAAVSVACVVALLAAALWVRSPSPGKPAGPQQPPVATLKPSVAAAPAVPPPVLPESSFGQPQATVDALLKRAIAEYGRHDLSAARGGLAAYHKLLPNRATQTGVQILNRLIGEVP